MKRVLREILSGENARRDKKSGNIFNRIVIVQAS